MKTRSFKINRDYYEVGEKIFEKSEVKIREGLTVLVGCNGSGKSTLLRTIEHELEKQETPLVFYDNLTEGGTESKEKAAFFGDMDFLISAVCSSEGEEIRLNLGEVVAKIGTLVRNQIRSGNQKEIWILLDAVDSGLDIANVRELKKCFSLPMRDCESAGISLYILVSGNSFEMARGENCLDVVRGKYIRFDDYSSYSDFILESNERKRKR